ncbi:MAG: hypothetical protein PHU45_02750 [Bacilli bacterium]|nr:hypothetical protein [Bacilli bacterium]
MTKKKTIREKPVNEKEYQEAISKALKNLNVKDKNLFKTLSKQGWFKSYGLKSKSQLRKITAKVKKGIKHGQFSYGNNKIGGKQPDETKGKRKTVPKKEKPEIKKEKVIQEKIKKSKSKTNVQKLKAGSKKYPDASYYEILHGINSKASQSYRQRHGKNKEYSGRIITKK